jgi:hypothetical protein
MRGYLNTPKINLNLKNKAAFLSFLIGISPIVLFVIAWLIDNFIKTLRLGANIVDYGTIPSIPLFIVGLILGIIGLKSKKGDLAVVGIVLCGIWTLWLVGSLYIISQGF